jgi:hypothetical protein
MENGLHMMHGMANLMTRAHITTHGPTKETLQLTIGLSGVKLFLSPFVMVKNADWLSP